MRWQLALHMWFVQLMAVTAGYGLIAWERHITADAGRSGNRVLWPTACLTHMRQPVVKPAQSHGRNRQEGGTLRGGMPKGGQLIGKVRQEVAEGRRVHHLHPEAAKALAAAAAASARGRQEDSDALMACAGDEYTVEQWKHLVAAMLRQHWPAMPAALRDTLLPVLHTEPPEPTASEEAKKVWKDFKEATAKQRSLSSRKLALQVKADKAKETWQQLVKDCQALQQELDDHQKVVEEIGKQYEEKVIRANLLEPPVPDWASAEVVGQRVAEATDQERQRAQSQIQAMQAELQQQVAGLKATVESMQQQQIEKDAKISEWLQAAGEQVPEAQRSELEKLLSGEDSKRRRVAGEGGDPSAVPQQG